MLKSIIKAVATPARLSSYAADGIQRGINGTKEETAATVAKYATITNEMAELAKNISAMLTAGRIDDMENHKSYVIAKDGKPGPISEKLYHKLRNIQYGIEPDVHGWITVMD